MSDYICFLITIFYKQTESQIKCALKVKRDELSEDCIDYPLEPENKKLLHSLLPGHVRNCGPIIDITQIFDITVIDN